MRDVTDRQTQTDTIQGDWQSFLFNLFFEKLFLFKQTATAMTNNEVIDHICLGSHRRLIEAPETRKFHKEDDS